MSHPTQASRPSTSDGQARFAKVPGANIERSQLDRSHGRKSTFDAGLLVPVWVDEALPGDTYNLKMATFCRLSTPIRPVMDNLYLDSFFFSVPNRLLWDNWKKMMGEQDKPGDSTDFLVPQIDAGGAGFSFESIYDHLGIPPEVAELLVSALPLRACNKIWNEWFRDENLQDPLVENTDDGPDIKGDYALQRRGKRHDYFTSCLPFPQKGEAVTLPLGDYAPIVAIGSKTPSFKGAVDTTARLLQMDGSGIPGNGAYFGGTQTPDAFTAMEWVDPRLQADLSSATAATINSIREAFQLQKLFERDARGGTRYVESIKAHFGVVSPDFRQQRSEYLGGGHQQITFAPVAQTIDFGASGIGALGAFAQSSSTSHGFVKSFTEHCTLIGFVALRADLNYQDGLNRMWSRRTRFDFAYPVFTGLGEQAVLNKEIFAQGVAADDDVFGYQERYAEYRYKSSEICGVFRSKHPETLDVWHLAQDFGSLPTLSASFIVDTPPLERIQAVLDEPNLLFDAYFSVTAARPLPVYGVPGNMDRL